MKSAPYRESSSLPGTFFERMIASCNLAEVSLSRLKYPANLASGPDALIFFCLLFFHQGKKRRKKSIHLSHQEKKRRQKKIKAASAANEV